MRRFGLSDKIRCSLAEGFSPWEKIYAQLSFIAMGLLGTVGILLESWPWVLPYIAITWYGIPGIVMRHLVCPRCPHLHEYGDCLQLPATITKWLVKQQKTTPFSTADRILFCAIFILVPTYPLYWLASHVTLLVGFLLMAGLWYSGQFLRFCKRCRVYDCPFNRVKVTHRAGTDGAH